ncbi:MAG TPA: redox-regulated ATPase YchF [Phycisphaerae bacterium]|nr:redox-regulated ATPase YchF [Phycisphaerae bacterium]HOJ75147.1 redox-regulated ATPase YchF [Phycisphaerae bacterium]HOM52377.1 redox-regulated ATPase YchF [Phycisphaerae bacterium]HON66245.1 redox-regulated ATPase YchF [Phycisphaerae bacterium]HOQ85162.1 redox-regulated ATPase YchF [Phycisphaerae bacterium]
MRIAFVGPPQSGKSTLFRAVTGQPPSSHPVMGEQMASVKVPDPRLDVLAAMYKPKKYTEATIDVLDVPGFSHETASQQAEFRKALPSIRQSDAIVAVVRAFENPSVPPYRNRVDPKADLDELLSELLFCDLDTVTTRIERLEKALTKPTKTHEQEKKELELMRRLQQALESEQPVTTAIETDEERKALASYAFLTELPLVVVINVNESQAAAPPPFVCEHARATIALCAETEEQIAGLEPADRQAFLDDLGVKVPARDRLIQVCYDAVGLISFLTCGEDEVRAWSVRKGSTAVEAAGKIHTDLARGFIRAETVAFEDLKAAGDMKAAKAAGKVRLEGKNYIVQDGDILNIKFNV